MVDNSLNVSKKREFEQHLVATHSRLFRYVHSLVRNLHDADDILQRATLVMWKKFDSFDRSRCFFSWSCGIVRFETLNFLRKRGREQVCLSDEVADLLASVHQEKESLLEAREAALMDCLGKLPERDRELVDSFYLAEQNMESIAQSLSRSSHSIYNSLRRIRRVLFDCITRTTLGTEGV